MKGEMFHSVLPLTSSTNWKPRNENADKKKSQTCLVWLVVGAFCNFFYMYGMMCIIGNKRCTFYFLCVVYIPVLSGETTFLNISLCGWSLFRLGFLYGILSYSNLTWVLTSPFKNYLDESWRGRDVLLAVRSFHQQRFFLFPGPLFPSLQLLLSRTSSALFLKLNPFPPFLLWVWVSESERTAEGQARLGIMEPWCLCICHCSRIKDERSQ